MTNPNQTDNLGGRPAMFDSPEDLEKKIGEYFNGGCRIRKYVVRQGKDYKEIELPVPTVTGLALFLGFESRQSFYDYEERERFSYIIKKARTFIEMEYEELLRINPTGAIFALKNMGWKDKSEQEITGKDGKDLIPAIINITNPN